MQTRVLKLLPLFSILFYFSCNKPNNPSTQSGSYRVTTYAGSGIPGFSDGSSQTAQFNLASGVAVNSQGILFVADENNNRIRRIALDSSVSTFAGTGTPGYVDGPGATAQFNFPTDVAVDGQGNLIVADIGNHCIRKITPAGIVSTIAGDGTPGYLDGNVSAAKFYWPVAVCVDASGNIYVSDQGNNRIRKISSTGMVTTLAGNGNLGMVNGNAVNAEFRLLSYIIVDKQNNIYITDVANSMIRKISNSGIVSTYAGLLSSGYLDGPALQAKFRNPAGLAMDAQGNLFVADRDNNCIRKVTDDGVVSTFAGVNLFSGHLDGDPSTARFNNPIGITITSQGVFFITDRFNFRIRKISK